MRIGFTGTQHGMTREQYATVLGILKITEVTQPDEFHSGDCIGADEEAHDIAASLGFYTVGHPPDNSSKRAFAVYDQQRLALPYLERNKRIVQDTDLLLAAPQQVQEQRRSGTWATVRYARRSRKRVFLIFPDGTVEATT